MKRGKKEDWRNEKKIVVMETDLEQVKNAIEWTP